jgi:hypothetical protein
MRYYRVAAKAGFTVDVPIVVNACLAVRPLSRINYRVDAASFESEVGDAFYGSFLSWVDAAVAHLERSQRLADRFRRWRASKLADPPVLGKPDPVGTPNRPIRRFRGSMVDVNAVLATLLAVRAFDREEHKNCETEFRKTLHDVYRDNSSAFLAALLTLIERERRFARRFRSWRRARLARGKSSAAPSEPYGTRRPRKRR